MTLHVFIKMSIRVAALIFTISYIQVRGFQQNGINNNMLLNKTSTLQLQSNVLQNRMSQLSNNQPNNFQSESLKLAKAFNLQQAKNLQNGNAQQPMNIQQLPLQTSLTSQQPNNLQQSLFQQQLNLQQSTNTLQNNLQQNVVQPQNQNSGNLQILRQASDGSVLSNAQLSGHYAPSQLLGASPPYNPNVVSSVPSITYQTSYNNLNSPDEAAMYSQNPQTSYAGVPSYILDMSQVTNSQSAMLNPTSASLNNQPPAIAITVSPQQHQQKCDVQNSAVSIPPDPINQISVIRSMQPQSPLCSSANHVQNQISSMGQALPVIYNDVVPTVNSIWSSYPRQVTQTQNNSSNLKSLLPLILNIIKERNSCGCNHCNCSKKTRPNYSGCRDFNEDYYRGSKYRSDNSDINSEEFDSHEGRKNSKQYGKHKNVKHESTEYDYSEEIQDE